MPSAAVYEAAAAFRQRLLARERLAANAMLRFYGESWARIHTDVVALTAEVDALRAAGEEVTRGKIMRLERMQAIQAQVDPPPSTKLPPHSASAYSHASGWLRMRCCASTANRGRASTPTWWR